MKTCFFDLETGGLKVGDPIIQFAGIAVDENWKEVEVLELKIKFEKRDAQPRALEVNHYTDEAWKDAMAEPRAVGQIDDFFGRHADVMLKGKNPPHRPYSVARIGGHNVVGFDNERLGFMFKKHGIFLRAQLNASLDTLQGAVWYFRRHPELTPPTAFNLLALTTHFGLEHGQAHEALADVRMSIALARIFSAAQS